jgi:hypothetical protein
MPIDDRPFDSRPFDPRRELDAVVGRYEPHPPAPLLVRAGRTVLRVLVGMCLAVAAAAGVIYTLHTQVKQAQTAPPPKKPVTVTIIPAK